MYIDDIIITGPNSSLIDEVVGQLKTCFALKALGSLNYFLGISVAKASTGLILSQEKYVTDILKKSSMDNAKALPTLMTFSISLSAHSSVPFDNPAFIVAQ